MGRRTEYRKEFSFPVEKVYKALATQQYWEDRVAAVGGENARLVSFDAGESGISVELQQFIARSKLPSVAHAVVKHDMVIDRKERWSALGETVSGDFTATMKGGPGDVKGTRTLAPKDAGSAIDVTAECRVNFPIVGGKLEKLVLQSLVNLYENEDKFTDDWIGKNL